MSSVYKQDCWEVQICHQSTVHLSRDGWSHSSVACIVFTTSVTPYVISIAVIQCFVCIAFAKADVPYSIFVSISAGVYLTQVGACAVSTAMLDEINGRNANCKATVERAQDKLQRLNSDQQVAQHQAALEELARKASALRQVGFVAEKGFCAATSLPY